MIPRLRMFLQRYYLFVALAMLNILLILFLPDLGYRAASITGKNTLEMLGVIPPIFIILGLLDVWVKRETMVAYMGKGSGLKGVFLAFMMGSFAAGPLYAAFPVAAMLMVKGASFSNVLIMVGAWSTTKIPLLLFEVSALGAKFTLLRLALNLLGIAVIAFVTSHFLSPEEEKAIYENAEKN